MQRVPRARRLLASACALALLVIAASLSGCTSSSSPPPSFPHSVYIWQRAWDPALVAAVGESREFAASLRVLVLQIDRTGHVATSQDVDWPALKATGLPVTAVVRIDGSLSDEHLRERVPELIDQELERWRSEGYGGGTLEIDYDCATSKLADYARLLADIRARVLNNGTLSITALPAWRNAPELDAVLAQVDSSVLQVHAVSDPSGGLFDAALAAQWVEDWSRRNAHKPFLVALPAYGARLKLDPGGRIAAVESEQRLPQRSAGSRELKVDPRDVAALIAQLGARAYPNLAGFAWFRLPREGDERAWSLRTLRAVIQRQPLQSQLRVALQTNTSGALDLVLHSDGTLDVPLPARLRVDGNCSAADGANGYTAVRADTWQFERAGDADLRAGSSRRIGWLRCVDPATISVTAG
jgi:hypothetical protein